MSYRKVDTRLWDDERVAPLSALAKLTWLCLLTGPHTTGLPGLYSCGLATLSESMREGIDTVSKAVEALVATGMVQFNPTVRVVRIPNAPKYNSCPNEKVLKGWLALWKSIPDCAEKFAHIERLRDSLDPSSPWVEKGWAGTFGTVSVPDRYRIQTVLNTTATTTAGATATTSQSPAPPEAQTTEAPKAPPPNPGETGALFVDPAAKAPPPPPPAKPAPKRRAPSKPKTDNPPPFSLDDAIDAISRAAGPRFEVGEKAAWHEGHIIATRKMIRRFPDLPTWTLVGEWLRAGGDAFRGPVTIEWTAEAHFSTAVMLAKRWHADGRPAITRNGAAPEPTPEQRRAALVAGADQRPTSTEYREPPPRDYDPTAPEVLTEAEIARREYARTAGRAALLALRNPGAKVVNS